MNSNGSDTYDIAIGYMTGVGRPQDSATGAKYMQQAADAGYMPAIRDLGLIYITGDGLEKDVPKGIELLSKAVDDMDPRAMYHMALLRRDGLGVEKDIYEALRLMGFAAGMNVTGAAEDAAKIETMIDEQRRRNLDSRPILKLEISQVDVEACCCKKMYDAVLAREIYHVESYKGPVLMKETEDGDEVIVPSCPFCKADIHIVPRDKAY